MRDRAADLRETIRGLERLRDAPRRGRWSEAGKAKRAEIYDAQIAALRRKIAAIEGPAPAPSLEDLGL